MKITECLFSLLALTRSDAEHVTLVYQQTSSDFSLTVSIPKTNHMVTRRLVEESDQEVISIEGGDRDKFP